jgi:hypothetical protein
MPTRKKTNTTMKESKEPNGSAFYSDFIVVNGNLYGLRKEKSGYYKSDWLLLWQ